MKQEPTKITAADINDASLKMKLYITRLCNETSPTIQDKIAHLAAENFLKFVESEDFTRENYERLRSCLYEKKSYHLLYIVDILIKSNRYFMSLARRDLEPMFKAVWEKVSSEQKKEGRLLHMRAMVKTWGVIYPKKFTIEQSLKKWLQDEHNANLALPKQLQNLFEESYEKHKNQSQSKLQLLMSEISKESKEQPSKRSTSSLIDLKLKIFQD